MNQSLTQSRPLTRSTNGVVAGVCTGIGERFEAPAWAVRLLWLLFMLAWGTGLALYIICWICMPRADRVLEAQRGRVLGVCFRLSRALNVDVAIVRILALFAALGSLGTFLIIYVILHFVIPKDSSNKLMNV